jgi:hypothetical protein
MKKENRVIDWHIRLSPLEHIKIVILAKLLRVKQSEAVRRAVQKMLAEESMRKLEK